MSGTSNLIRLSVDMMGGDQGIEVTAPGLLDALSRYPDLICHAVGDPEQLHDALSASAPADRLIVVPSSEVVAMDEPPASALRFKKDSSMRVAINQLSEGRVSGCVSAGNTGALMATARFVLKTLPGIDRPAIIAVLPRSAGHVHMLDLGANVESPPEVLFQFGLMGSSLVRTLEGAEAPTVGLLNVGSEEIKGSDTIKTASEMLRNSDLNYVGYVEGDDIFNGEVDLIVCDGFEGNIALKTSEGLAQMLMKVIREEFTRSLFSKLAALIAKPVLRAFQARIDHRRYNGAMLLGLRGVVIKSHGGADRTAFSNAIGAARLAASKNLISQIESDLEATLALAD